MLAYLASPYTHVDPTVREYRYRAACLAAATLMQRGEVVFSPIAHSHPISKAIPGDWAIDHEFWLRQDAPYLEAATKLYVLRLDGWRASRGVEHEIARSYERGIPIAHLEPFSLRLLDGP